MEVAGWAARTELPIRALDGRTLRVQYALVRGCRRTARRRFIAAVVVVVLGVAGCGDGFGRIGISRVTAASAHGLVLGIDACHANAKATVISTSTKEIVVRVDGRRASGGDACSDGLTICLDDGLAGRSVRDDTSGQLFETIPSVPTSGPCEP